MLLCHGTSGSNLTDILANGIRPRRTDEKGNWEDYPSATDRTYLTQTYAPYYGMMGASSLKNDGIAIIEVDVPEENLIPDEDPLGQLYADSFGGLKESTEHWKAASPSRPDLFAHSLELLGTCAHMGVIKPEHITRAALLIGEPAAQLICVCDPVLSIVAYKFMREYYENLQLELIERHCVYERI